MLIMTILLTTILTMTILIITLRNDNNDLLIIT
jgi:hypothetical protein